MPVISTPRPSRTARRRDRLYRLVTRLLSVALLPLAVAAAPRRARQVACQWALAARFPAENLDGLTPATRAAFEAARTEALWRHGELIGLTDGYRDAHAQARLFADAVRRTGSATLARNWTLPPHESSHVAGTALDVRPVEGARWLERYGSRHHLYRVYDNEWWHFEYRPDGRPPRLPNPGASVTPGPGDNAGMARDDGMAQMQRLALLRVLDGTRPSAALEWVSPVAPAVTQAVVGAGHWAAGRRRRALAAWARAAGLGLVAWGLGAEAPTRAEADKNMEEHKELLRKLGTQVPATAGTQAGLSQGSLRALDAVTSSIRMVVGVRSGLRQPQRLTVLAIAREAPAGVFYALRVARAVQRRRPRIAVGSALVVAGSVARLRAASAEPLR